MNEKFSIPGAILLAGVLVAGAILLSRSPARTPAASPVPPGGQVAGTAQGKQQIVIRPIDAARDHIRGSADAKITIVEYSDTECPFCKRFHPTLQRAVKESDGKVRWVYRHFPLETLHQKAPKEAEATECANDQGKFWEYLDRLYEVTPSNDGLDPANLPKIATEVGADRAAFEECLRSGKHAERVQQDVSDALKAGGQGTPYSVILGPKGETIPFSGAQPYENLKQVLDALAT